ncbi:MAG: rhodanese-like domain-containing protein [Candidatus Binataceae bacterium]
MKRVARHRSFLRCAMLALGAIVAVAALAVPARAFDLGKLIANDPTPPDHFKLIHVKDLAKLMADKNSHVHVYDANRWSVRAGVGIVPGARLLTSPDKYDVTGTLPADKNADLVFYCADPKCMASHEAARRATNAGYTDVNVMADGIFGWKTAGEPVTIPKGFTPASKHD